MAKTSRAKQVSVLFNLPPHLYRALKAEIRSQGMTVRDWLVAQMKRELQEGPAWRAFIREQSQRPEANEVGLLSHPAPQPDSLQAQEGE